MQSRRMIKREAQKKEKKECLETHHAGMKRNLKCEWVEKGTPIRKYKNRKIDRHKRRDKNEL